MKTEVSMLEQQNSGNTDNSQIAQERKENAIKILEKARRKKGLSHREALLLLDCEDEKKNEEIYKLLDNTNNGPICMSTPKLEVVEINYTTKSIPNIKVGDIIYGTINVLDEQGKSKLHVSSKYVNYINVYVNDELVNTLPMSTFGNILSNNYKLKKIQ